MCIRDSYVGATMTFLPDMSADCRSTYLPICGSALGRYVAIDCRWCIGRLSVVSEYCSPLFCWNSSHLLTYWGRERRFYRLCSCVDREKMQPKLRPLRIHIYSQFFSNRELPSRVRKARTCKIAILFYALKITYPIHEANISKTKPVTPIFFYKNHFIIHRRRNRKKGGKFCGVCVALTLLTLATRWQKS